jgi:glycosyltransferase involved in cell wall biosynthesis
MQLPSPPAGVSGWPWDTPATSLPATMPDGRAWPRVSIVTPSYNQVRYLEETIRSVLLQGYPNLEYIIVDGGSTDGSVEILHRYAPWLTHWTSEPDRGQSEALNKGFARATGEIVAWLNSDDTYLPGAIALAASQLAGDPDAVLVYSDCNFVDRDGHLLRTWHTQGCTVTDLLLEGNYVPQPTAFIRGAAFIMAGGIDTELHYVMDHALWTRLGALGRLTYRTGTAANFRYHPESKSQADGCKFAIEWLSWLDSWSGMDHLLTADERQQTLWRSHLWAATEYVLVDDEHSAAHHFQLALLGGRKTVADTRVTAERIAFGKTVNGRTLWDSHQQMNTLARALRLALGWRGMWIWREIRSVGYMQRAFDADRSRDIQRLRSHLWRAIWLDPGWLRNSGVLSIAAETLVGRRATIWLRGRMRSAFASSLNRGK